MKKRTLVRQLNQMKNANNVIIAYKQTGEMWEAKPKVLAKVLRNNYIPYKNGFIIREGLNA